MDGHTISNPLSLAVAGELPALSIACLAFAVRCGTRLAGRQQGGGRNRKSEATTQGSEGKPAGRKVGTKPCLGSLLPASCSGLGDLVVRRKEGRNGRRKSVQNYKTQNQFGLFN